MAKHAPPAPTILRRKQVQARTGLSRSSIYAKLRYDPTRPSLYDPTFPKPISIGPRAKGWIEGEVDAWVETQIRKSRDGDPTGCLPTPDGESTNHPSSTPAGSPAATTRRGRPAKQQEARS